MATHGRARELTISALNQRAPFKRPGFGMSAVEGAVSSTGQLPTEYAAQYNELAKAAQLSFTVLSYSTPIAWVTKAGTVVIPDTRYSRTTTHHQNLCRVYL